MIARYLRGSLLSPWLWILVIAVSTWLASAWIIRSTRQAAENDEIKIDAALAREIESYNHPLRNR